MTKICSKCKTAYSATSDFFYRDKSKKDGFGYLCKKCKNEYVKQYDLDNPDKMKQRKKLWKQKNPEKIKQQHNKYWQENPDKKRFYKQQRRAKKRSLQATFITEQWDYCKYYFNNKCAYCGKEGKLAQDHFIPLNNNGDYTINNIIPAIIIQTNTINVAKDPSKKSLILYHIFISSLKLQ